MELLINKHSEVRFAEEVLHYVKTLVDLALLFQREHSPSLQQSGTHRRHGAVDDVHQTFPVVLHRIKKFERTDGELVQPYIPLLLYSRKRRDVAYLRMLRQFKVLQYRTACDDAVVKVVYAEAF